MTLRTSTYNTFDREENAFRWRDLVARLSYGTIMAYDEDTKLWTVYVTR